MILAPPPRFRELACPVKQGESAAVLQQKGSIADLSLAAVAKVTGSKVYDWLEKSCWSRKMRERSAAGGLENSKSDRFNATDHRSDGTEFQIGVVFVELIQVPSIFE